MINNLNDFLDEFLSVGFSLPSDPIYNLHKYRVTYVYSVYELRVITNDHDDINALYLSEITYDPIDLSPLMGMPVFHLDSLNRGNIRSAWLMFSELFKSELRDINMNKIMNDDE